MNHSESETEEVRFPFNWDVPLPLRRQVTQVPGQQRALSHEGHLLMMLHQVPTEKRWHRDVCMFWRSPEGVWMSTEQGEGLTSLQRHLESYAAAVQQIEDDAERLESTRDCHLLRRRLAPIHRAAHNLNSAVLEAHQACPEDDGLMACFNVASNVRRATDLLTEDIRNTFEFAMAQEAERQSRTAYRLSLLTATFFPIMTFATIFGMNLTSGLEKWPAWMFWGMVLLGIGGGLLVRGVVANDQKLNPWKLVEKMQK